MKLSNVNISSLIISSNAMKMKFRILKVNHFNRHNEVD